MTADGETGDQPVEQQRKYLQSLTELETKVRAAEPEPDPTIEGAAGLLAGRIGGRIDQARARILQMASQQGRPAHEVAMEVRTVLQDVGRAGLPGQGQMDVEE